MNLVNIPTPDPKPEAQIIADDMLAKLNANMGERVHAHQTMYRAFWSSSVTPDEIIAAMGTNAGTLLGLASASVAHLATLAAIAGKSLHDFIQPSQYLPKREIIIAPDGTGTIAEKFGHDAWGNFIPVPEDPQRSGYNVNNNPTYGKYSDGTDILQPLPAGAWGYTENKEVFYGYNEDGTPILVAPETPMVP